MRNICKFVFIGLFLGIFVVGCKAKDDDNSDDTGSKDPKHTGEDGGDNNDDPSDSTAPDCSSGTESADIDDDVPTWIKDNFTCIQASLDGTNIVIKTQDLPPYKSYYYGSDHDLYEEMPSANHANPNQIEAQNYTLTIPASPSVAGSSTDTELDAIGVSVKGTALYNNEAAPGDSLSTELATMDKANGHPTQTGAYHHHTEPLKITDDDDALVGIMLDGFPVYGRQDEDGTYPSDLDDCNGHTHATTLFPSGIYHYHITSADPYIAGCYKGTPGTVDN